MSRIIKKEQRTAQKHPVGWPLVFIVVGIILVCVGLGYIVTKSIQASNNPNPNQKHPVEQLENSEENQFQNTENSL